MLTPARYVAGETLFGRWRGDVLAGSGPVVLPHTLPRPEISPGLVTLIGGAPGAGKTALTMMAVVEALRHTPSLRALVANCEMAPTALLDRQLARLSGIEAEVIRHRRFVAEHAERLEVGLATLESIADRLAFLESPYDLANVAAAADAHAARVLVIDYIQRFAPPGDDVEARHRVSRTMDYLRRFAAGGHAVLVLSAVGRSKDSSGRSSYTGSGLSLASFRESSELEFGADDAFILAPIDDSRPEVVRLAHLKSRHSAARTIDLRFDRGRQSFTLLESVEDPVPATGGRRRRRKPVEPDPAFSREQLDELWAKADAASVGEQEAET
jgi:replicative DNA helicase